MTKEKKELPLWQVADRALKKAVHLAIQDHAKTGDPVVIFRDGKVIEMSAVKLLKGIK